ncbi:MAG: DUF3228 family protein [Ignavibacteria bacterium]|nr:DUF3228 family protein [Ignavibacteria bacterium]
MKIKLTDFSKRHFDKNFGGTKILNMTPEEFEKSIDVLNYIDFKNCEKGKNISNLDNTQIFVHDGYASFCKLVAITNFTDAKVGSLPITLENYQYLRSGYSARRDNELPVFSRWLELPLGKPKAEWLILILYSYEQLHKEHSENPNNDGIPFLFDGEWGIVAILGQSHPNEEPMKPETMIRNALGISEGGSGVPLDREKYLKSVDFWDKNATVK